MAYVPSHDPWEAADTLTTATLNNFETIYDETYTGCLITHNHDDLYETQDEMKAKYYYSGNLSGSDADYIHSTSLGTNLHATQLSEYCVQAGLIVLWYGSVASIPDGWALCDGTLGTRDLRNKFVIGAGDTYAVAAVGGSNTINPVGTLSISSCTLTEAEMGAHLHPFVDKSVTAFTTVLYGGAGSAIAGSPNAYTSGNTSAAGSGEGHTHSVAEGTALSDKTASQMPYYYALAYIEKL